MHQLGFGLVLYAAAVLQGGGTVGLFGLAVQPHCLMLVVIVAVLYFENWTALLWAALAGLLSDCLSTGPLGVDVAGFVAAALFLQQRVRRPSRLSAVRLTWLTFGMVFTTLAFSNTIRLLITGRQFDHARLVLLVFATALVSAFTVGGFRLFQAAAHKLVFRQSGLASRRAAASH